MLSEQTQKGPNPLWDQLPAGSESGSGLSGQELCRGSAGHGDAQKLSLAQLDLSPCWLWPGTPLGPSFGEYILLFSSPRLFQLDAAGSASRLNSDAALCCSRVLGPWQLQGPCRAYFSGFPSIPVPSQVGNGECPDPVQKSFCPGPWHQPGLGGALCSSCCKIKHGLF